MTAGQTRGNQSKPLAVRTVQRFSVEISNQEMRRCDPGKHSNGSVGRVDTRPVVPLGFLVSPCQGLGKLAAARRAGHAVDAIQDGGQDWVCQISHSTFVDVDFTTNV